jgi:hypothetical protein
VSTPGSGGPQPPEQDPRQPGQPAGWGQQPPAGQPYPGPQPPVGQPYPGPQQPVGQPYPGQQQPVGQPYPGQQQPVGQPYPGQQQPVGQPYPGQQPAGEAYPGQPYPGQQPPAGQPWGAPPQPGAPQPFGATGAQAFGQPDAPQKPKRKWLPIVGGIVALLVVLAALTSFLGGGDPKVGDCIQQTGASDFKTVDCDSSDAERKVVGVDGDMTGDAFRDAPAEDLCTDFPETTFVLWSGSDESEDGHVYCTTDV